MEGNTIERIIKLNAQTSGRDKVFRTIQYLSKMVWHFLEKNKYSKERVETLKNLESSMSSTRKMMRLAKSIDFIQGALKSLHLGDVFLRVVITLSKINQALYMLFDNMIWLNKVGMLKIDAKKYTDLSAKFWLTTIIFAISRNFYDIYNTFGEYLREKRNEKKETRTTTASKESSSSLSSSSAAAASLKGSTFFAEQQKINLLDLAKNLTDLPLPLCALNKANFSPGWQGLFGTISSFIGLLTVWNPRLRLVP